jgi:hypothetical protein
VPATVAAALRTVVGAPPTAAEPQPLASRRHTFRFLLIVAGIAAVSLLRRGGAAFPGGAAATSRLPLYVSLLALELGLVWFVVIGLRKQGRAAIDLVGRRWRSPLDAGRDVLLAAGTVVMLRGVSLALQWMLAPAPARTAFLLPRQPAEILLWVVVSIAAGCCEEAVFRGYLQPQLWALGGSLPLAVAAQALIFGVAHLYQGWRPALVTAIYGLGFGLLAAWRRSIVPGAIAHALIDVIGGLAGR